MSELRALLVTSLLGFTLPACVINNRAGPGDAHVFVIGGDAGSFVDAGDAGEPVDAGPITNTIEGSVSGVTLNLKESIFLDSTTLSQGASGDLWVLMSDTNGMCGRLINGLATASSVSLSFYLVETDGFGNYKAATPGNFLVATGQPGPNQQLAYVAFTQTDATCHQTTVGATDGYVTLNSSSLSSGGVADGRFDFTFENGHVSGGFVASFCTGPVHSSGVCN